MKANGLARLLPLLVVLPLVTFGCGGGGGGTTTTRANLGVFVTDGFSDNYDHVWVTIYRVELVGTPGTVVVYDDPTGKVVDLKTLRDASGALFDLLAFTSVPAGTYSQVRVTIGNTIMLFPRGSATGQSLPVSADTPRDSLGRPVATFTLNPPLVLAAGSDNLVIDFDLDSFTIVHTAGGDAVSISVKQGSENGITNRNRHDNAQYEGVISGLTGTPPNQTFTLTIGSHMTVVVTTNASTAIFNAGGATNPVLANGKRVHVRGTFDPTTQSVVATEVKIQSGAGGEGLPEVQGVPSNINAAAGTFTLTITEADNFVPPQQTVTVVTNTSTVFRGQGGVLLTQADFFTLLATATMVEVQGTYDAGTNTLTATTVKIEEDNEEGQEVEASGPATNINPTAQTFTISPLSEWDGFIPVGNSVDVVTNGSTRFRGHGNTTMTASDFFAALVSGAQVSVGGTISGSVITARQVRLRS